MLYTLLNTILMFFVLFQDSEHSPFNFISTKDVEKSSNGDGGGGAGSSRKRGSDEMLYSFVKRPMKGMKTIKIEIYDICEKSNKSTQEIRGICRCKADICVQHIVQSVFLDDIYLSV